MRSEKELLKQEIKDKMDQHKGSFVIMQYKGLKANAANEFRREVGKMGGDVEVMRKRILMKAAQDAGIELDASSLEGGHIGVVFLGNDPIETTKMVFKFSQDRDKVIQVLGGRFEGKLYQGADVEKLSTLPSRDEMRAQFLSILEAPMSQTLAVMDAVLASVIYCLDNKAKENEEPKQEQAE